MKFLHVSDLHFHKKPEDNTDVVSMLDSLNKKYPNHYLIVTGDITDDGNERQFKNAYEELRKFDGKIFICPGNHDFGAAGNLYSKSRAKDFDEMLMVPLQQEGSFYGNNAPVINVISNENDKVMLIALDSNLETSHPFDFACGKVGEEQLDYLGSILSDPNLSHMIKIVFLHHHPFIVSSPFMELKDAEKLMRLLYSRVDVLMFGHKHKSKYWENHGGIAHVLAAENTSIDSLKVRELSIESGVVTVTKVDI
ncbi:MAG: metallophosphoesterase [Desulfobacteraceae bacterium]|nr:metallophosphoesterase [Desulfobacteraceae bacterium]